MLLDLSIDKFNRADQKVVEPGERKVEVHKIVHESVCDYMVDQALNEYQSFNTTRLL